MDKTKLVELINNPKPTILDIGSYNCRDALQFDTLFNKQATIFAFEADPRSCELCRKAIVGTDIILLEGAIGNSDGECTFNIADAYIEDYHCSGSLNKPHNHLKFFPGVKFNGEVTVKCRRLDTWASTYLKNIEFVDLVWMDVNGAEESAIMGGSDTFLNRTKLIATEFSNHELYLGQINKQRMLELLPGFDVIEEEYHAHGFGDIVLKNSRFQ